MIIAISNNIGQTVIVTATGGVVTHAASILTEGSDYILLENGSRINLE